MVDVKVIVGKKAIESVEKTNTLLKESIELLKKEIKLIDTLNKEYSEVKSNTQLKAALNKQEKANIKIQKAQESITKKNTALEIKKAKIEEAAAKKRFKNSRAGIKADIQAKEAKKKLNAELRKELGLAKKSGGLFRSMAKSMIAVGVAAIGIRTVFNVFKKGLSTIVNFEEAMSKVKAVSGALPKEFKLLTANAKLLGGTTSKSATQVAALQLEFSKLGFSTQEILNATEATISLSIAAGSDLAESAIVAASTIRGFGLDAKDTQRVVDVMARSFSRSALDLEKFKTSMSAVAPIAKANGKDIEFVTARLAVLSDAGLDASTSGTSLRNMFLELSKRGLTWEQGLKKINTATDKNVEALRLFGKRGATAALILADNIEKAQGLEEAFDNAAGSAENMATIMEDNLRGELTQLSSAWEGFVLSINEGTTSITNNLRRIVKGLKSILDTISDDAVLEKFGLNRRLFQDTEKVGKDFLKLYRDINEAVGDVSKTASSLEDFDNAIAELTKTQSFFNKETDIERAKFQLYGEAIEKLNDAKIAFSEAQIKAANEAILATEKQRLKDIAARESALKSIDKLHKEFRKKIKATSDAIKKAKFADHLRITESQKQQIIDDWKVITDHIEKSLTGMADNPTELTIGVRTATQELLDAVEETIDDSPVSFWDKLLATDGATTEDFINQFAALGDTLFDLTQSRLERELESVRSNYDARIQAAEGNSELQEALSRELAQKQWAIELELAKSERNQAIISATIAAAVATVKALPNIALAALTAAAGIVEIAAINAQPLPTAPQFEKGSSNTPSRFIAGDGEGSDTRELIFTKDGKVMLTPNHATLYDGMAGSTVLPSDQTKQILNTVNLANSGAIDTKQLEGKMDMLADVMKKTRAQNNITNNYANRNMYNERMITRYKH